MFIYGYRFTSHVYSRDSTLRSKFANLSAIIVWTCGTHHSHSLSPAFANEAPSKCLLQQEQDTIQRTNSVVLHATHFLVGWAQGVRRENPVNHKSL